MAASAAAHAFQLKLNLRGTRRYGQFIFEQPHPTIKFAPVSPSIAKWNYTAFISTVIIQNIMYRSTPSLESLKATENSILRGLGWRNCVLGQVRMGLARSYRATTCWLKLEEALVYGSFEDEFQRSGHSAPPSAFGFVAFYCLQCRYYKHPWVGIPSLTTGQPEPGH
jgi:hypothetical protein